MIRIILRSARRRCANVSNKLIHIVTRSDSYTCSLAGCADYADIGETCKENHSKKRVKKECNHARFNETRDRLRKKLTQIVNDRKSKSGPEVDNHLKLKITMYLTVKSLG